MNLLDTVDHRPWPLPDSPWTMTQCWYNLLFAHWPVPQEQLRHLIPEQLPLDTYDGQAWVGVVPFQMSYRLKGLPLDIPFLELNVRTYVMVDGKPGVYFFSLDASHIPTVLGARLMYGLPYFYAQMQIRSDNETHQYHCKRNHPGARPGEFSGTYAPTSPVYEAKKGSLEHWLTERYCLYSQQGKDIYRANIHHLPWPLQEAQAEILLNTMGTASNIHLPETRPVLHYSQKIDVLVWPLEKLSTPK